MASALPSVPVPYDQPLRDLMRDWSADELRRALDHAQDADEARHWLRAYLADRPREWLLLVFGEQFVGSLATEAHLALIRSIGEVMPYKLGRSAPPIAHPISPPLPMYGAGLNRPVPAVPSRPRPEPGSERPPTQCAQGSPP
jgi:hypothetical protein